MGFDWNMPCVSILLVALLSSSGCLQQTPADSSYAVLSVDEFKDYVENEDVFLLDVFHEKHGLIAGTDDRISYDRLKENPAKLPEDKNTPIAVYCKSDLMSRRGAEILVELGYKNITRLSGGTTAWRKKGYPLY